MRTMTMILVVAAVAAGSAQGRPGQGTGRGGGAPEALEAVDIVVNGKVARKVASAAIKKASTRKIVRYGQEFDATPFEAVLKLAGIPAGSRVRVIGEEDQMTLGRGGEDPAAYVVIFNMRGIPVLTPVPGASARTPGTTSSPQVQAALPPPGSRGGSAQSEPPPAGSQEGRGRNLTPASPQSAPFVPPPAGSGAQAAGAAPGGGSGRGNGSGPGTPAGFGRLNEVRSFSRIEIFD